MNIEQWVEEHCQCGIDKSGKWSEELFAEFGCTCRDNLTHEFETWLLSATRHRQKRQGSGPRLSINP